MAAEGVRVIARSGQRQKNAADAPAARRCGVGATVTGSRATAIPHAPALANAIRGSLATPTNPMAVTIWQAPLTAIPIVITQPPPAMVARSLRVCLVAS
jgi:hypothetical protein